MKNEFAPRRLDSHPRAPPVLLEMRLDGTGFRHVTSADCEYSVLPPVLGYVLVLSFTPELNAFVVWPPLACQSATFCPPDRRNEIIATSKGLGT